MVLCKCGLKSILLVYSQLLIKNLFTMYKYKSIRSFIRAVGGTNCVWSMIFADKNLSKNFEMLVNLENLKNTNIHTKLTLPELQKMFITFKMKTKIKSIEKQKLTLKLKNNTKFKMKNL